MQNSISNGFVISLTGKDKMCLIDGTIGGALFASHDFGRLEIIDPIDATITREPIEIKDIIREAVHVYANEPYANIIINDLDDVSVELLDYKVSNQDCIIYQECDDPHFISSYSTQIAFTKDTIFTDFFENVWADGLEYNVLGQYNNKYIRVIKYLTYGQTAGYRRTPLIYPSETGELTIDAGGTIGDLLKKIVEAFGEFEYFYDIYGRFNFQRKRIYHNVVWNGTVPDAESSVSYFTSSEASQTIYDFTNGQIIESYANKPELSNVRNDWAIWGKICTGDKNAKYACHLRYAIDDKPVSYHCLTNNTWYVTKGYDMSEHTDSSDYIEYQDMVDDYYDYIHPYISQEYELERYVEDVITPKLKARVKVVDWREILYRMAIDYKNAQMRIKELQDVEDKYAPFILNELFLDHTASIAKDHCWYYEPSLHSLKTFTHNDWHKYNEERVKNQLPEVTWANYLRAQNKTLFYIPDDDENLYEYRKQDSGAEPDYSWLYHQDVIGSKFNNQYYASGEIVTEIYVSDMAIHDTFQKYIKLWESRLTNRYAIYFADMLGFWNIYYKSENNLVYDDVPPDLQATLTYQVQLAANVAAVGYAGAQSTYITTLNSIERMVNVDDDGRRVLVAQARVAYQNKATKCHNKIELYERQFESKIADTKLKYHERYDVDELRQLFADEETFYTLLMNNLENGGPAADTQTYYDNYVAAIKLDRQLLDEKQIELKENIIQYSYDLWVQNNYWNPNIIKCDNETDGQIKFLAPESMLFWIDFLDAYSTLGKYKVSVIGHRAKTINDDKVNAIFYRETPSVLWLSPEDEEFEDIDNISYIRLRLSQGLENYFQISHQGKSAKDELDTLLYETTHYNETITVNCLPIYYLEPNHRIRVVDNDSGIRGEYIIKNYNLQLTYDGMMSLTAYKAADRII